MSSLTDSEPPSMRSERSEDDLPSPFKQSAMYGATAGDFDLAEESGREESESRPESFRLEALREDSSPSNPSEVASPSPLGQRPAPLVSPGQHTPWIETPLHGEMRAVNFELLDVPTTAQRMPTTAQLQAPSVDPTPTGSSRWRGLSRARTAVQSPRRLDFRGTSFTTQESGLGSLEKLAADPHAPKHGDPRRAYAASVMRRCVKKSVVDGRAADGPKNPRGKITRAKTFIDPTGIRVRLERFGAFMPTRQLHEFGCPIAVKLYLHFLWEGGLVFLLMALVSAPAMADSWLRNQRRQECRQIHMQVVNASLFPINRTGEPLGLSLPMTGTDAPADAPTGCGYLGPEGPIGVRDSLPLWGWWRSLLLPAVSTCSEYAADPYNVSTAQVISTARYESFVDLDATADYCHDGTQGLTGVLRMGGVLVFWSLALNALIFALFLLRVRRMQVLHDAAFQKEQLTAADFAAMAEGLARVDYGDDAGVPKLERRLRADLSTLGFDEDAVDHIELGRDCGRELEQLRRLASLRARKEELRFQLALQMENYRSAGSSGARALKETDIIDSTREALAKVAKATTACRAELKRLRSEKHVTTGHAFIVFQRIRDRDRFINLFNPAPMAVGDGGLADLCPRMAHLLGHKVVTAEPQSIPKLESAGDRPEGVRVSRAPEPDDIYWENLETSKTSRRWRKRLSYTLLALLVLIGAALLYTARFSQINVHQHSSMLASDGLIPTQRFFGNLAISGAAVGTTQLVNLVINAVTLELVHRERHPTRSAFEKASFTKLILAYSLNTVVVPIAVSQVTLYDPIDGSFIFYVNLRITQAWYESGGVVFQAAILIISTAIVTDFLKVAPLQELFQRHVLGRYASSQIKLNRLWAPPPMALGSMYAETYRTLVLGMVYAPIYPPAFFLTALALFLTFFCTKFAIAHWYMRPPLVDGQLMKRMRNACVWLLLACVAITAVASLTSVLNRAANRNYTLMIQALPALAASLLFWCCIQGLGPLLSRTRYFSTRFRDDMFSGPVRRAASRSAYDRASSIRYNEVTAKLGYIIERYECPSASRAKSTNHLEEAAFRQGFRGGFVDAGVAKDCDETDEQGSATYIETEFFPPVALPAPPEQSSPVKRRPPAQSLLGAPWVGAADPVKDHLGSALETINEILADLGGGKIIESTELSDLSREVSRRIVTKTSGPAPALRPPAAAERV